MKKEPLKVLCEEWSKYTRRVAFPYPRKKVVSFDGHKVVKVGEAIEMMLKELPEEITEEKVDPLLK